MKPPSKFFHWLPRVLCIIAILFISLFAADSFSPELTFWQQIAGFFMHLIPSFVLLAILILAWKWELVGSIAFGLIGLVMMPLIYNLNYKMNQSVWISLGIVCMIALPFFIIGILFFVSYSKKRKYKKAVQGENGNTQSGSEV